MSHQVNTFIEACPVLPDRAEMQGHKLKTQEIIRENAHSIIPILADISVCFDFEMNRYKDTFFLSDSKDSKEVAQAKIAAWKDAKRLIENLIHQDLKEAFNASRRSRG